MYKITFEVGIGLKRNPVQDGVEFHREYFNLVECGSLWTKHNGEESDDATK
jgi:hypothetical protein